MEQPICVLENYELYGICNRQKNKNEKKKIGENKKIKATQICR